MYKCEHCGVVIKKDDEFLKKFTFEDLQVSITIIRSAYHSRVAIPEYIMHDCSNDNRELLVGVAKLIGCGLKK